MLEAKVPDTTNKQGASTNTLTEVTATNTTASKMNIDSLSLFNQLNPTECETEVIFSDDDDDSIDLNFLDFNVDAISGKKNTDVGNDFTESDKNFNIGNDAGGKVHNIDGSKESGTEIDESPTENVINNENDDNNYKSNKTTANNNIEEDITDCKNSENNVNVSEWPKKGKPHSRNLKKVKERKERERLMSQGASGSSHEDFTFNESQNTKDKITNDRVTEIVDRGDGDSKTNEVERDGEPPFKRMKPHSRNMKKAKELRRQRELLQFNRNEENTSLIREINFEVDVNFDEQIDENMIGSDEGSVKIDDDDDSDDETVADDMKSESQSNDCLDFRDYNAEKLLLKAIVPLIRIDDNKIWRKHAVDNTIDLIKASNITDLGGRVVKRRKPSNPDFDIRLKGLSEEFVKVNKELLKLCVPASVVVDRISDQRYKAIMLLSSMRTRRTKVSLPSIDEVRRINRSLLTAQVAPLSLAHTHKTDPDYEEITTSSKNTSTHQNPGPSEKQDEVPKNTFLIQTQEKYQNIDEDRKEHRQCKYKNKRISQFEQFRMYYLEWQKRKSLHLKKLNIKTYPGKKSKNSDKKTDLVIDLTETDNYDTQDNMIKFDTLNDQNTSELTDKLTKNDQNTSELTDKLTKNDQNTSEFTDKTNKNDQNTSEFTDKTNKNDHNTSEVDTERCKNEPPKPKLKLVPTSRLQSEFQVKLNPVIENSSPATVGLQARMGLVATLNHENTHKYEDNELFSVSPLNEDPIQTLPYIVSKVSETNNIQCSTAQGLPNVLSMEHIQQDVLPMGQNLQNVLPAEQYNLNVVPTVQNLPDVLPVAQNLQNVLPAVQNLPNVLSTVQNQQNVLSTGQNILNVLPTVQNQPNVLSTVQNQKNVLSTGQNQLSVLPTVQNLPNVLSTVQNQPDVLPVAQNLQNVLPTAQNQPIDNIYFFVPPSGDFPIFLT